MKHLHQHKEALTSFLTSLDLDPDNAEELTDLIADVAGQFCNIPKEMSDSLKGLEAVFKCYLKLLFTIQLQSYSYMWVILRFVSWFDPCKRSYSTLIAFDKLQWKSVQIW